MRDEALDTSAIAEESAEHHEQEVSLGRALDCLNFSHMMPSPFIEEDLDYVPKEETLQEGVVSRCLDALCLTRVTPAAALTLTRVTSL